MSKKSMLVEGKIITPIITKKTTMRIEGYKAIINNPHLIYYGKITIGKPMRPYSLKGYLGRVIIEVPYRNKQERDTKVKELLKIVTLGRLTGEGCGRIKWLGGKEGTLYKEYNSKKKGFKRELLKIRKGLPHHLTEKEQQLLTMALLHDFVHTSIHKSKIYVEVPLEDKELLDKIQRHHEKETTDPMIAIIQKYDRWAAGITRKYKVKLMSRYNYRSQKEIDFEKLAGEIATRAKNVWKLYEYIYNSKELEEVVESMVYGYSNLKEHVLVMVNLLVRFALTRTDKLPLDNKCG